MHTELVLLQGPDPLTAALSTAVAARWPGCVVLSAGRPGAALTAPDDAARALARGVHAIVLGWPELRPSEVFVQAMDRLREGTPAGHGTRVALVHRVVLGVETANHRAAQRRRTPGPRAGIADDGIEPPELWLDPHDPGSCEGRLLAAIASGHYLVGAALTPTR